MEEFDFERASCTLTWNDVVAPGRRDAQRHALAVKAVARQLAFEIAGASWSTHLKKHRAKLMNEAADIIASRAGFVRWRFRH